MKKALGNRGLSFLHDPARFAPLPRHIEHVFPQVPVRHWVITFPWRLRFFLHRDPVLLGVVRRSVLRTIETGLRRHRPDAPRISRCGAVPFVQRLGSALNAHAHLHCCVTDGMFSLDAAGALRFHPAADLHAAAVSAVQRRIRRWVLRSARETGPCAICAWLWTVAPRASSDAIRSYIACGLFIPKARLVPGSMM
jgi:hypothetical protein